MDSIRPSMSVVIVTLNEEARIRDCLESVKWADEIVVFDSLSQDRTAEICREYTSKVWQMEYQGGGPMRNLAIEKATGWWILTIDADERVPPELKEEILRTLAEPAASAYYVPRKSYFLGRWIRHGGWWPDYVLRLFRKEAGRYSPHLAHAQVVTTERTARLSNALLHYPFESLHEYVAKINSRTSLMAREKNGTASVLKCFVWATAKFFRTYVFRLGFLDGGEGLVLAILASHYAFLKHTKTWEANRRRP
jgi:glycosyltransferase involved in cell wall biosynthesis